MYIIGENNRYIKVKYTKKNFFESVIWQVIYDCSEDEATIFRSLGEVLAAYNEIQSKIENILVETECVFDDIINEHKGFNKFDYVKKLKIYQLVPKLLNKDLEEEAFIDGLRGPNSDAKIAYNYFVLSCLCVKKFLAHFEEDNDINTKEDEDLKKALEYIDEAIELDSSVPGYYKQKEVVNALVIKNS